MPNILRKAIEKLTDIQLDYAGDPITYHRQKKSVPLTAVVGPEDKRHRGENGTYRAFTDLDLIVRAADLVIDGEAIKPLKGDRIELEDGSMFTVMPPDSGDEHCWRYAGSGRVRIRIHTKRTK
jgi:hypothetical protein